jgi:PAS domain S-box-containing protein
MMIYYNEPHEFTRPEFELAMTIANQIAPGVERKRAEARLLENEERLRLATQAGKVGVWDWEIRKNRIEWTDAIYEMHGLHRGEFDGTVEAFSSLVHPDDRAAVRGALERSLSTGESYEAEFRTVRPDGETRWLYTNARVMSDADGPYRLIGATSDITERVRAESARRENEIMQRLVEAQESERQRIARDLHDHLGQKMTGLRFKIESALSKTNEIPELQELLDEIQESALQIDHDIGFLSWELRPTELDTLGLDDALGSFVREWSAQYAINAQFHSNLSEIARHGRLSNAIEMNLYRIAQEGLNNVMKHANASNVSVLLQYRRDSLVLIIEDDGQGLSDNFYMNAGKSNGSFGLIGMHERAALLKGTFEIESRPGKGTTLITTVPLYKVFASAVA